MPHNTPPQFAKALDAEDYDAAIALLADDCVYQLRGETHNGPVAIIDSYRGHGDDARDEFDSIQYESVIEPGSQTRYTIRFIDHLTHDGERFTFECRQVVDVNDAGLIVSIEHIDLPGQRKALEDFRRRVASTNNTGGE